MTESKTKWMVIGSMATSLVALTIGLSTIVFHPAHQSDDKAKQEQVEVKASRAVLDPATIPVDGNASGVLQALLDTGAPVELPAQRITLARPVYLPSGCELRGMGNKTEIYAPLRDALVAMPTAQRQYDPSPHLKVNPISPEHWSFRTHRTAGIRLMNTHADHGWTGTNHWTAVREFTVEFKVSRHGSSGALCGLGWNTSGATYLPSPWLIWSHPDWQEWIDFKLGLENGTETGKRFKVGPPSATPQTFRFRVDLNAGTIICEVDGVAITGGDVVHLSAPLVAGAILTENHGSPLWIGGANSQAAGPPPPELGCVDIEYHTWRLWKTANPPAIGTYDPFAWTEGTVCVFPFANSAKPIVGDPAVEFTGQQTAFAYLTPFGQTGGLDSVRISRMSFVGDPYGAGLTIISSYDVRLESLRFNGFAVGLQILGGPLPCYPVRMYDISGNHQADTLIRVQRSIVGISEITAKYPKRSVIRADNCGIVVIDDVFHAGENAGITNTVRDVIHLSCCGRMEVNNVLSNYEDGVNGGPRKSYLKATGPNPEPNDVQILRVRDFAKQTLRPGARYMDVGGLGAGARVSVIDSFGLASVVAP